MPSPDTSDIDAALDRLLRIDPLLAPYREKLQRRLAHIAAWRRRLVGRSSNLAATAAGHEYFGLHRSEGGWVLREWAPNAQAVFLVGDFSQWREDPALALRRRDAAGTWQLDLPAGRLWHGAHYRLRVHWPGGSGDRLPAWCRRVVQDPHTLIFNAQVWHPPAPYRWRHPSPAPRPPLIYEAHAGMAREAEAVGTWNHFTDRVLPRIAAAGYNTVQLMAVAEHPYYASFGYQVANFFAPSSRFGTPEELMALVDTAHGLGLRVLMDLVHSHAASNTVEGLACFDGSDHQFFHAGERGRHPAWGSCCFDYGKPEVQHFLLSNCRYWLDAFRVDGFRMDGITSMLYRHHGLGWVFGDYNDYFNEDVDEDALAYLALANEVIHAVRPDAVTIAEDISGMPGLALAPADGGVGFDYRFAMGIADAWERLATDVRDEEWSVGHLWHVLTDRRPAEASISYVECHDQALVGGQPLIYRLVGPAVHRRMRTCDRSPAVDRGIALHKLIRLLTLATAGNGYLTFMGNEFGHPDWIDFPREGNHWSYRYARRQWSLAERSDLRFAQLARFDRDMLALAAGHRLLDDARPQPIHLDEESQVLVLRRAGLLVAANLHPIRSYADYRFAVPPGAYRLCFDSDAPIYGGHGRLAAGQRHVTLNGATKGAWLQLYLPSRTVQVLEPLER